MNIMAFYTFSIDRKTLAGVAQGASKDQKRYDNYLCGIYCHIDSENPAIMTMVASDGHLLIVKKFEPEFGGNIHENERPGFIMPLGFVKAALKAMSKNETYRIRYNDETKQIVLCNHMGDIMNHVRDESMKEWNPQTRKHEVICCRPFKAIDHDYFDYVRVFSREAQPTLADMYVHGETYKRIQKTFYLLGDNGYWYSGGNSKSAINSSESLQVFVMLLQSRWVGESVGCRKEYRDICVNLITGEPYTEN